VGKGWRHLHGGFRERGYSIEWHDFATEQDFDWSRSFHPGGVEICLNLAGRGEVQSGNHSLEFVPFTAGFYAQNNARLSALRRGGERHQFITIELSLPFLESHVAGTGQGLHPRLRNVVAGDLRATTAVSEPSRQV
jgi:hypothetical protein